MPVYVNMRVCLCDFMRHGKHVHFYGLVSWILLAKDTSTVRVHIPLWPCSGLEEIGVLIIPER